MSLKLTPNFSEFCKCAKKGNLIPVFTTFLADTQTPVLAALKLQDSEYSFLLESVEGQEKWATYSFLGVDPQTIISIKGKTIEIRQGKKVTKKNIKDNPFTYLKNILSKYQPVAVKGVPRFHGGALGYLSYDCVRVFEKISDQNQDDLNLPDAFFMITDTLVVFHNVRHQIQIIANAKIPEKAKKADLKKAYENAEKRIKTLYQRLSRSSSSHTKLSSPKTTLAKGLLSKKKFIKIVERAKSYVREGDIIQVVLSNRYEGRTDLSPFQIYRALRMINPSPYMYYLRFKDFSIVGSSPETLVRLEDGNITLRPIAGTRRRGKNDKDDLKMAKELLADPKERAEHIMLVDLGRNDLGRVAKKGTVKVSDFFKIERYSHVMHLVSNVEAKLRKDLDAFDLLRATFPAGTLSGAPKIRAMEIIDELEEIRRGPYGGALGYISFSGNMDLAITIRTLLLLKDRYILQAGAGIVADSDPKKEYLECENKAKAILKALDLAKKI